MKTPDEIKKGMEYLSTRDPAKKFKLWQEGIAYDWQEDAAADALARIQQLEAQVPRWIPVEERLPEKHKIVLVFKRRTAHFIWSDADWNIEADWCGEDGWSRTPHNGCFAVTHWMPLPQPPKEEEE